MAAKILMVKHTATRKGNPLVCFANLPGPDAEMTPEAIRQMASSLLAIASDCETHARSIRRAVDVRREYAIEV
jgi:hypothetical protein